MPTESSSRATEREPGVLSDATRRLLRSARISPSGSDLEEDLALRTPALLQAVDNHWGVLASGPVDTDRMKKALTRLALEILNRDDRHVPLDWIRSHLVRGAKTKEKFRAVVGGVKQMFRSDPDAGRAMENVKEGFQQADSLPVQLVRATQKYGLLKLVSTPGEPANPRVGFSHDALLYAFGALHDLTPRLLWTGVDDSGESPQGRRLYLAKLSLLDVEDLAEGLDRVAEKDPDVAAAFVLHDREALRREGEAVAKKYFQRVEWKTWRADVEEARWKLDPFGDAAARAARAWTRKVLEDVDLDLSLAPYGLAALPLAIGVLGRHGRALDLDLLRRVEHHAPRLGHQRPKHLRQDLERARETLAQRATTQETAKRTGKKVAATVLVAGMGLISGYTPAATGGAALGADHRREENKLRHKTRELPDEIEALEEQLEDFRRHVATLAREAIEAIEQRTG